MTDELMAALEELFDCHLRSIPTHTWARARREYLVARTGDPFAGREPGIHSSGGVMESACHRIMVSGLRLPDDVALVVKLSEGHPPHCYCYPCACLRHLRGEELKE